MKCNGRTVEFSELLNLVSKRKSEKGSENEMHWKGETIAFQNLEDLTNALNSYFEPFAIRFQQGEIKETDSVDDIQIYPFVSQRTQ